MELGVPKLSWEKHIDFPDHVSFQYVANPVNQKDRGVMIYFQTDDGDVGRIILHADEADLFSRKLRDTLIENKIPVT